MSEKLTRRGVFTRLGGIIAGTAVTPLVLDASANQTLEKSDVLDCTDFTSGKPVHFTVEVDGKQIAEAIFPPYPRHRSAVFKVRSA